MSASSPGDLGLVGHERGELAGQPDRLVGERAVGGRRVPGREREIEHGEHAGEALLQLRALRNAIRDARIGDLALGPNDALGDRALGHEEGSCDLRRGQPAHRPQGQGEPRLRRQGRVTAREDEPKAIVGDLIAFRIELVEFPHHRLHLQFASEGRRAPQPVEGSVLRDGRQPRARIARDAVARPRDHGRFECLGGAVLGERPVASDPDQRRHDPGPLGPVRCRDGLRDGVAHSVNGHTGRSSIRPNRAIGCFDAISIASSRSVASIMS